MNSLISIDGAGAGTFYAYDLGGAGTSQVTSAAPGGLYPTTNTLWDGTYLYALVSPSGSNLAKLARCLPGSSTSPWEILLGGQTFTVCTSGNVTLTNTAQKCVAATTDGQNLYFISGSDALSIYNIASDSLQLAAGACTHFDQLIWDGANEIYGFLLTGYQAACFKFTIDSQASSDAYPVTTNPNGGETVRGYAAQGTTLYTFWSSATPSMRAGHCADDGTQLAFTYGAAFNNGFPGGNGGGCFVDGSTWAIGNFNSGTTIALFTVAGNTISDIRAISQAQAGGNILQGAYVYTAPYGAVFILYEKDGSAVPAFSNFGNGSGYAPGVPTGAVEYLVSPISNLGDISAYIPVQPNSVIAPYVQLSLTPSGPWQDAYDGGGNPILLDMGAGLAGQLIPLFVRVVPPANFFPGAFADYEFSIGLTSS